MKSIKFNTEYEMRGEYLIHRDYSGYLVFTREGRHVSTHFNRTLAERWIDNQSKEVA